MGGTEARALKILVVDDDPFVLRSMQRRLRQQANVVTALTLLEAGEVLQGEWPIDAALLDFDLGYGTALDLLDSWPRHFDAMAVLVFSGHHDVGISTAVQQRRAQFARKPLESENYAALLDGARQMTIQRAMLRELAGANLNDRQMEIVLIALGEPSRTAAAQMLQIPPSKLKKELERILRKLDVASIDELRLRILRHGTVPLLARIASHRKHRHDYSMASLRLPTEQPLRAKPASAQR